MDSWTLELQIIGAIIASYFKFGTLKCTANPADGPVVSSVLMLVSKSP